MTTTLIFSLLLFLIVAIAGCVYLAVLWSEQKNFVIRVKEELASLQTSSESQRVSMSAELEALRKQIAKLSKWTIVADADEKARELLAVAKATLDQAEFDSGILLRDAEQRSTAMLNEAKQEAAVITGDGRASAKHLADEAQNTLAAAIARSADIIAAACKRAEEIAGEAYDAIRNAQLYERTAQAMKNIIEGYGDQYLMPAESLLDNLAEGFGHKEAGQELKLARTHVKRLIKDGVASRCDYAEVGRKEGAERFVLDAFNGKVDSILSRVRDDNFGKLEQEIRDAFTLVNYNGKAFRNARITDEYLAARLAELKWAAVIQQIKTEQQEEQRRLREQIREEEKAKKEYERAIRESAKEEEVIRNAMAKAEAQIAQASEEQRAKYEQQLAELNSKLQAAEERNQRAISMAQQTRRGHVYIISNTGSFGENVYKIGLTRRLEPLDRVRELGDSSVPFEFDVHALILSDDAPALEHQLHKHFVMNQVNKVNHRKEFFRAELAEIRREIEGLGVEAKWTMAAEAREYRESLAIDRAIHSDPAAREAWINRQLTLEPLDFAHASAVKGEDEVVVSELQSAG